MPACNQTIIVISAATIENEVIRHGQILQAMRSLGDFLQQQIRCAYVSPVLQNWPRWQWQLIGEVRHEPPASSVMQSLFALEEFKALKAVAATDCLIFRPAQPEDPCSDPARSPVENGLIPTYCQGYQPNVAEASR